MDGQDAMTGLGNLLREAREGRGLSIRQLAEASGVDKALISRLEAGMRKAPEHSTLNRLATALAIDAEDLYEAAGYFADRTLPSLPVYFRSKFALSDEQIAEVQRAVEEITHQSQTGAQPQSQAESGHSR